MVFLFGPAGAPERLHYWNDQIRTRYYDTTPAGLPGNDDGGTLSSWYIFSAMGMYPIAGGPDYILANPIFERVDIDLGDGTPPLVLVAPNASPTQRGVSAVSTPEGPVEGPTITHAELIGAGEVRFEMTPLMAR